MKQGTDAHINIIHEMPHHVHVGMSFMLIFLLELCRSTTVGVSEPGVLNRLVNLCCVLPLPDGDAKRHKVYTGSGNGCPTSSLRRCSCIPCTGVLVVGGYKLGERGSSSQVSVRGGDMNYRMRRVVRASIRDSIRRPQKRSWLPPFIAAGRKPGVHKRATRGARTIR